MGLQLIVCGNETCANCDIAFEVNILAHNRFRVYAELVAPPTDLRIGNFVQGIDNAPETYFDMCIPALRAPAE